MTREEIIDFLCDGEDYACPFMQDFQAEYVVDFVIKNYITWEDIKRITQIYNEVSEEFLTKYFLERVGPKDEELYKEVLKRFNENKQTERKTDYGSERL